jgi:small subunit ribosomal protein S20e
MADKDKTNKVEDDKIVKARITISGTSFQEIQQVTAALLKNKKEEEIDLKGPVRMPTKNLKITCRKTPCGEGTKTWDCWEMKVYKRYFNVNCASSKIRKLTDLALPRGVKFELTETE